MPTPPVPRPVTGFGTNVTWTRTLDQVREQVATDDTAKWDALVPSRDLSLHEGRLCFPEAQQAGFDTGLALTPWATGQVCQKLDIPGAYFRKCPSHLKDSQFNYWNGQEETRRTLTMSDADAASEGPWFLRASGGTVRGALSHRYTRMDNATLLALLLPLVENRPYKVGLCQLTSESFHLRLVDSSISRDVLPGDRLFVGIHIANSEVGLRAVTVDAMVFRLVCTNGLIRRVNDRSLLKQRHIHVSEPRFASLLATALHEAITVAAGFIEQMAIATRITVPNPEMAIELLGQAWGLTRTTQDLIRLALLGELANQQETLYGLVNAVTNAAQRLSVDDRYELEAVAALLADTSLPPTSPGASLRTRILSGK